MSPAIKSTFAIGLTVIACVVLVYFVYSFFWFVLVGRRTQEHKTNVYTGIGFAAVIAAVGLWALVSSALFQGAFAFERLVLFTSVGLCVVAMAVAKFGGMRTAVPIVTCALIVALNAIGTLLAQ